MGRRKTKSSWASVSLGLRGQPIVCLRANGATRCLHFTSAEHLADVLRSGRLSVHKWVLPVPGDQCILKTLGLPAEDLDEAAQMAGFELPAIVPLSREELTYGCTLLRKHEKGTDILVWIVKLDVLNRCLAPYRAMGIEPQVILPDALAIRNWFASNTAAAPRLSAVDVLVDAGVATVIVSREGHLQTACRIPPCDEQDERSIWDAVAENWPLWQEPAEPPEAKTLISFTGDMEHASRIRGELSRRTASDRCEFGTLEPVKAVSYPLNGEAAQTCEGLHHEAIVAEGLLLALSDPHLERMNLLPEEYAARHRRRALFYAYGQLLGLLLVVIVLAWSLLAVSTFRVTRQYEQVRSEIAPIRDAANAVAGKRHRLQAIQRQLSDRGQLASLIRELYKYTPAAISFYELTFNRQQDAAAVEIKGQADFLPTALEYTDAVQDAKLLVGLQIVNAQQVARAGGGSVVEFKASCTIRSEGR